MSDSKKTRCEQGMSSGQGWFRKRGQCLHTAVAEEDGHWYCKKHLPSVKARKLAESMARYDIEYSTGKHRKLVEPWHRTLDAVLMSGREWAPLADLLKLWIDKAEGEAEERLAREILDIKTKRFGS